MSLKRKWLRLKRWLFRALGGYHLSEHKEIVWAAEVEAEKETAQLRLYKVGMEQRHRMFTSMLREELEKRHESTAN